MSMRIARPIILNHIVSPYGLAFLSTLIFLVGWCFPDDWYSRLMNEPDLMFFDPRTLLFFLLCFTGFCAGLLLVDFLQPSPELLRSAVPPTRLQGIFLALPLIITTAATALAAHKVLKNTPDLLTLLLEQQGTLKNQLSEPELGLIGWGANMQAVMLWWTYWKLLHFESDRPQAKWQRRIPWFVFVAGLMAQTVLALLRISRSDLMPVFGGLGVLYLLARIRDGRLTTARVIRFLSVSMLLVILAFVAFAVYRGAGGLEAGVAELVGYTLASYNRLAALLAGTMRYPYGGRGAYLVPFALNNHFLSSILPLKDAFGWPGFLELRDSEFQGLQGSGLNPNLIWSGAFGYLFADVGWAAPLILGAYGFVYGIVWKGAKAGGSLGICLYPWFAFSALTWFTWNQVVDSRLPFLFLGALGVAGYEKVVQRTNGISSNR